MNLAAESGPPLLATLVPAAVTAVLLSPLTAWITYVIVTKRQMVRQLELDVRRLELVKKPELVENVRSAVEQHRRSIELADEQNHRERVRQETLKWANPILGAVEDLRRRLGNVLDQSGYQALSPNWQPLPGWSITHEYFLTSTLYLFAVYFGYVESLRQSISFELFRAEEEKDRMFAGFDRVSSALGNFPPDWVCEGSDAQVFRLQQRALGELMIADGQGRPSCITYPDFLDNMVKPAFITHTNPVRNLVEGIGPHGNDCRWRRLAETRDALSELSTICEKILMRTDNASRVS